MEIKKYAEGLTVGNMTIADFDSNNSNTLFSNDIAEKLKKVTNIRIAIPAYDDKLRKRLLDENCVFVDRMMDVSINLRNSKIDFQKYIRFPLELSNNPEDRTAICEIAYSSFVRDRRFHVQEQFDQKKANQIIKTWIDELPNFYLCRYKNDVAGFLALHKLENDAAYIHMAAVSAKYRPSGAALSMYASAIMECKKQNCKKVIGFVSSGNTPVLNLYSTLGASFDTVTDIFVKEIHQ